MALALGEGEGAAVPALDRAVTAPHEATSPAATASPTARTIPWLAPTTHRPFAD